MLMFFVFIPCCWQNVMTQFLKLRLFIRTTVKYISKCDWCAISSHLNRCQNATASIADCIRFDHAKTFSVTQSFQTLLVAKENSVANYSIVCGAFMAYGIFVMDETLFFFRRIYCMFIVLQDTVRYPVRKSSADVRWSVDEAHTHTPLLQCYSYPQRANGGTLLKCIRAYDAVNAARQHSINFLLLNSCTVWYIATNTEHIHTPID